MFRWSLLFLAICLMSSRPAESADQPNIVLLLADDLGWKDVGFHGSEIETPHLDKLAAGGTEMTQFYVQPVCSPTRGALLTGKYPSRLGLQCGVVRPWAKHGLPLNEQTLPQAVSEAGYFTAICGKWHLGHASKEQLPLARGFDHQYGHYNGALDYFTHLRDGGLDWHRNQEGLEEEGYTTTLIGAEAVRLIEAHDFGKRPMFLYVPFNAPHTPLQAPENYLARYESIRNQKRRTFAAMVTCMDDAIGSIVAALSDARQTDNTLILFSSDNGGPRGLGADNGLLRAGKGTLYEGGVRVPTLAHWPNVVPAGAKVDGLMHIVDLYPTLLAAAAVTPTKPLEIDGVNQWPVIMGGKPEVRHDVLLNTTPFHGAVRVGSWKLVHNGRVTANATSVEGEETFELFNLEDDPYEKQDLSESHPEKLTKLKARLQSFADAAVEPNIPPNKAPADFQVPKVW
jgi:arylsulfatase A-like enzyme